MMSHTRTRAHRIIHLAKLLAAALALLLPAVLALTASMGADLPALPATTPRHAPPQPHPGHGTGHHRAPTPPTTLPQPEEPMTTATTYTRAQITTALDTGLSIAADAASIPPTDNLFTLARTAILTLLDTPGASRTEIQIRHAYPEPTPAPNDTRYTRNAVDFAVTSGVDLTASMTGQATGNDLGNFIVNAILDLLDDPITTFEDIIERNYSEPPATVRSWL